MFIFQGFYRLYRQMQVLYTVFLLLKGPRDVERASGLTLLKLSSLLLLVLPTAGLIVNDFQVIETFYSVSGSVKRSAVLSSAANPL